MRIFYSLGRLAYRYRWFVVLVWGTLLLAGAFFAPNLSDRLRGGGFEGANSESEQVQDVMIEEFGLSPTTLIVVFEGDGLEAGSPEFQEARDTALDEVRELDEVENVIGYSETNDSRFISESGERSYALVNSEIPRHQAQGLADDVRERVRNDELTTYVTGSPAVYLDLAEASNEDIRKAEKYAFPLALVILVLAFGSLAAAGIPILIGGAGVVVTLSALYFLAGVYEMSVFALTVSTMLGLGLGIDYALFAVSRFREELENGPVCEAVPRTVETAGRSIFFSGTAVLIGLAGLLFFPYMFMRSIGVAGALVVLFSVASALTLLPAVLGILGPKVNALSVRRRRRMSETIGAGFWTRSAEVVMRHPLSVLLVVGVVLLVLLYPVAHMKIGVPEASVLPKEYESRQGDDILKEDFDYASLTPIDVVATLSEDPLSAEGLEEIRELGERVEEAEGIDEVESIYTVGEEGAREYAERLTEARKEAEAEAAKGVDEAVEEQIGALREQYGSVTSGAEEQIRAEAEERAAEELNAQEVPELPESTSADSTGTPENVAVATLPDDSLSAEGLEEIRELGERVEEAEGIDEVESIYTVGEEGAREYAERLTEAREEAEAKAREEAEAKARKEAEAEAAKRAEESVAKQLGGLSERYGSVPLGAKESLPAEAERRATEELDNQLPELPEGSSADDTVTPEDVANFLALPQVQESEEMRNALDVYTAGDKALLQAVTEDSPYTQEARNAVGEVRSIEPPTGTSFLVGGLPAGQKDLISNLYSNAPYAIAFVLGVTYLVLFFTFRSFFIPLKAVIVNILSLTASFGAMVFVFQDGNLSGLLGFTPLGFVDATLPILMFCTIFGVSMDYEVFLLSRIRESYEYGESNTESVAKGLVSTAGIITSAAAIIVVVTGAFAFTGITTTKAIGLGLAVAVFVDATIIRVLLVPATMRILGDWNWWPGGRKNVFRTK